MENPQEMSLARKRIMSSFRTDDNKRKIELLLEMMPEKQSTKTNRTANSIDVHTKESESHVSSIEFRNLRIRNNDTIPINNREWFHAFSNNCEDDLDSDDSEDEADKRLDEQFRRQIRKLKKKQKTETFLRRTLCKKTNISNGEIILMCILLAVRHSLSWVAMLDIINLINKLFDDDVLDISKYKLLHFFPENEDWITYHVYCNVCKSYLGKRADLEASTVCSACQAVIPDVQKLPYFIILDADSQLKEFFENPLVQPHLQYRYTREKKNVNNIEDILDGMAHQFLSLPGNILHDRWNFSYTFNTDGCQAMNSSPLSVWPVYMKVNELPPDMRDKYMMTVALWVSPEKPIMNTLLQPVVSQFNKLSTEGVTWNLNGTSINSKIIPRCCSVDSPCRCSMLNMKQYNGFYGCTFCYHPTTPVDGQRKYTVFEKTPELRTHQEIYDAMKNSRVFNEKTQTIEVHEDKGVKGPSALMNMEYFNMGTGMTIERLHVFYAGNICQFTEIIMTHVGKPYYVGSPDKMALINQRLLSIQPPNIITRQPMSLELRHFWKASQWRSWAHQYSLPCLEGILPLKYLRLLARFVISADIMSKDSISPKELDLAEELSIKYVRKFERAFGQDQMTYNVHLFSHAARSVRYFGPFWAHDAFSFEGENSLVLGMIKSPTEVAVQIAKRYMFYRQIPRFSTFFPVGPKVIEFAENFEWRVKSCIEMNRTFLIGTGQNHTFNGEEVQLRFQGNVLKYEKMLHNKIRYTSARYSKDLKTNDSVIETIQGEKGVIQNIYYRKSNEVEEIIIFFNRIKVGSTLREIEHLNHIREFTEESTLSFCYPNDLKRQCIVCVGDGKKYICEISRGCYGD